MTDITISVVSTIYNCAPFIKESILSIVNQTYKDFEIIIYDDGSTDDSYGIAEFVLKNIGVPNKLLRSSINRGVGFGRNRSIEVSSGKFIAIQDGDDVSLPNRLEKEIKCMEEESLFCVSSGVIKIDARGTESVKMVHPEKHNDIVKKMIRNINPICDPACLYRKDIFNEIGRYREEEEMRYVPDWDLWCRAALLGFRFCNLQDYLVKYRLHINSNCYKYLSEILRQHKEVYENFHRKFTRQMLKEIFKNS